MQSTLSTWVELTDPVSGRKVDFTINYHSRNLLVEPGTEDYWRKAETDNHNATVDIALAALLTAGFGMSDIETSGEVH